MDYVALLTFRDAASAAERDGALMRRTTWQYPAGVEVMAEYWPMSDGPHVVIILATDDAAALMQLEFEWNNVFDMKVAPAVSADQGLEIGPEVFGRLARMQSS